MVHRQLLQHPPPFGRNLKQHTPPVRPSVPSRHQISLLAAIAKLHQRIVTHSKPLSQMPYRHTFCLPRPRNLEKKLMLLRMKTSLLRRRLAEVQKQPELMAKFSKHLKPG